MSKLKKFAGILLALVMCFGLTCTAFAADSYTITINNSTSGYTYVAYQIFTGTLDETETILSDIEWGSGITDAGKSALISYYELDEDATAADVAEAIADAENASALATLLAGDTSYLTSGTTLTYSSETETYSVSGLAAGYYLVVNTVVPSGTTDTNAVYSNYIVKVVDDVTMSPKASEAPTGDKSVDDINDSTETEATTSTSDSADYDIGDAVPFTLTATLPTSNFDDYKTYALTFHDTLSDGLSFNADSVKVYIDGTLINTGYTIVSSDNTTDGCTFEVVFTDVKTAGASAGSTITVTYTATLLSTAAYKETNTMYLEYSNNPNSDSTGTTPEDITTVFTYTLTVNKTDEESNPLTGAGFTLYKYDADTETYVAVGSEITGAELTSFVWKGLDDGQYKLVETTTPDGYNTMADVEFTITATHTENGIESLTISGLTGATTNVADGTITATIQNEKGSSLPSTGGMGTTIFYVVGGVLVVGAVVLLITKKRMSE